MKVLGKKKHGYVVYLSDNFCTGFRASNDKAARALALALADMHKEDVVFLQNQTTKKYLIKE